MSTPPPPPCPPSCPPSLIEIGQLSDICLARVAAALVAMGAVEDPIAATLCPPRQLFPSVDQRRRGAKRARSRGQRQLGPAARAREAAERLDPVCMTESACRAVCDGIDEDNAQGVHSDAGLGLWRPKRGATIPALKAVCRTAGTHVSGNKDRLVAHLRRAWKMRGLGRIGVRGLPP